MDMRFLSLVLYYEKRRRRNYSERTFNGIYSYVLLMIREVY